MTYDVDGRLLNGIKNMYVGNESCVSCKSGVKYEWLETDSVVKQGCVMCPWLLNLYMDRDEEINGGSDRGVCKNDREWKIPCLLHVNDFFLYEESEEILR